MGRHHNPPVWTPGCGRPHPDIELIKEWAEGKVTLIEKQRLDNDGRAYGQPVRAEYPCWNPVGWKFAIAKNTQMLLDLGGILNKKLFMPATKFPKAFSKRAA